MATWAPSKVWVTSGIAFVGAVLVTSAIYLVARDHSVVAAALAGVLGLVVLVKRPPFQPRHATRLGPH